MSDLLSRVQSDLNSARRAHDRAATLLLGTIVSDIKNREIELRRDLVDDDVIDVLRRGIKRRRESIEMFTKGNRPDLATTEAAEVTLLEHYLPAQVAADEIRAAVRAAVRAAIAAGATNMGAIMGQVMPAFKGRAEGGQISAMVKEEMAGKG